MLLPAALRIKSTIARVDSGCQKFMMLFVVVIFQRVTEEFKSFVTPKLCVHRKRQIPLAFNSDESDVLRSRVSDIQICSVTSRNISYIAVNGSRGSPPRQISCGALDEPYPGFRQELCVSNGITPILCLYYI